MENQTHAQYHRKIDIDDNSKSEDEGTGKWNCWKNILVTKNRRPCDSSRTYKLQVTTERNVTVISAKNPVIRRDITVDRIAYIGSDANLSFLLFCTWYVFAR